MRIIRDLSALSEYPYILPQKSQQLSSFPLKFYNYVPGPLFWSYGEFMAGSLHAFHSLLKLMATHDYDSLEELVEYNLYTKIREELESMKSRGLKMSLNWGFELSEAKIMSCRLDSGCIYPFRNLNRTLDSYSVRREKNDVEWSPESSVVIYENNNVREVFRKDLKRLCDLNLREMNKNQANLSPSQMKDVACLSDFLYLFPISIRSVDVLISTPFKSTIKDASGRVIDGNLCLYNEVHCLRLEAVLPFMPRKYSFLFPRYNMYKQWVVSQFSSQIGWIISDIDGYMGGNPVVREKAAEAPKKN